MRPWDGPQAGRTKVECVTKTASQTPDSQCSQFLFRQARLDPALPQSQVLAAFESSLAVWIGQVRPPIPNLKYLVHFMTERMRKGT